MMPRKGREFEQLVERLEAALSPAGAVVTSPDRIPDKTTGELREVDVSIRYRVGTADILITVECRDRSAVQDVTWIEQIAAKSRDIGAALTIAVSSSGFSPAAITKAQLHNILIRTTRDLDPNEFRDWLAVQEVKITRRLKCLTRLAVELDESEGIDESKTARPGNAGTAIFVQKADGRRVTPNEIFEAFVAANPTVWKNVEPNGESAIITLRTPVEKDTLSYEAADGTLLPVKTILTWWKLTLTVKSEKLSRVFDYSDSDKPLVQAVETEIEGTVLSLHRDVDSGTIHASVSTAENGSTDGVTWTPAEIVLDVIYVEKK
jgi:hypothetical protein